MSRGIEPVLECNISIRDCFARVLGQALKVPPSIRGNGMLLTHLVLFYRTQKSSIFGKLSWLCQIVALFQHFFMIYVPFLGGIDKGQVF
jgi:hypothetical protein